MGGGIAPARQILDPLYANGIVLTGPDKPVVLISVDWCEIRNDAYDRWRETIANAAGTDSVRVLVSATHVHDAPVMDLEAQRILDQHQAAGRICDLAFHEETVQKAARAVKFAMQQAQTVTHFGVGRAKVEKVASNRRYTLPDGRVSFDRTSSTRNPLAHEGEEGTVDPWLKTLSFWNGFKPVAALSCYATHPMSYYAQALRPDSMVMVAGYGESAPGYIPTDRAWEERDSNLHDWCWVAPGAEKAMKTALDQVLK